MAAKIELSKTILKVIERKLASYETLLKERGLQELSSSLERHAKWWFEHYIKNKTYDDIADSERKVGGGNSKYIGACVRRFSKLIGIDPEKLVG